MTLPSPGVGKGRTRPPSQRPLPRRALPAAGCGRPERLPGRGSAASRPATGPRGAGRKPKAASNSSTTRGS